MIQTDYKCMKELYENKMDEAILNTLSTPCITITLYFHGTQIAHLFVMKYSEDVGKC